MKTALFQLPLPEPCRHLSMHTALQECGSTGIGLLRHPPHPLGSVHLSLRPFPMSWALPQAFEYYCRSVAISLSARRFIVRRFAWSFQVPLGGALTVTLVISPSSQAEGIAPSSSGRHSTTSRLMFAQSRANHKRPSLHSILGAGASLDSAFTPCYCSLQLSPPGKEVLYSPLLQ